MTVDLPDDTGFILQEPDDLLAGREPPWPGMEYLISVEGLDWWSDGHVLLRGPMPKLRKTRDEMKHRYLTQTLVTSILRKVPTTEVEIVAKLFRFIAEPEDQNMIVVSNEGIFNNAYFVKCYRIARKAGEVTLHMASPSEPLYMRAGGEIVAVIMPMAGEGGQLRNAAIRKWKERCSA
jgi:hypothetical protein